jgi:hypothetical protein
MGIFKKILGNKREKVDKKPEQPAYLPPPALRSRHSVADGLTSQAKLQGMNTST